MRHHFLRNPIGTSGKATAWRVKHVAQIPVEGGIKRKACIENPLRQKTLGFKERFNFPFLKVSQMADACLK